MARAAVVRNLDAVVTFDNAGVRLPRRRRRKGGGKRQRIRRFAGEVKRDEVWRIRGLTARITPGESVAIVGMRGAGQQAILRMAAGTLLPDEGAVQRNMTVIPMIEIARAFSRVLSVRQNIYFLGGLFGMSHDEVTEKLPGIVAFADVQPILDRYLAKAQFHVKQRLAWTIALSTDADAYAIDQILVVGDRQFRQQCWTRMDERRAEGATFLINSDSPKQFRRFCDRALYLEDGRLAAETTVDDALARLRQARQSQPPAN